MKRLLVAVVAACALTGVAAAAPVQPNDPAWPDQWAQKHIGLPQVWETTTGDPNVVIATIDTGVNEIPELQGALVPGWDFVENDAVAQDTHSHGTRVASVIAARGNNGIGMAGHCWGCRIMPIRVTAGGSVSPERIATGHRLCGRARRADHQCEPQPRRGAGSGRTGGSPLRDRPRGARRRFRRKRGQ